LACCEQAGLYEVAQAATAYQSNVSQIMMAVVMVVVVVVHTQLSPVPRYLETQG
jgi:hypothetical protein